MITIYPESAEKIRQQLGLGIQDQPDDKTLMIYRRLLMGFSMIMERDSLGFDLIDESTSQADVEKILEDNWNPKILYLISDLHGYWRTAILRSLEEARKKFAVLNSRLEWVQSIDPVLHGAMVNAHRPFKPVGSEILALHLIHEMDKGYACVFDGNAVVSSLGHKDNVAQ